MNLVPDTSVVVDGRLSAGVESGEYAGATVYVPEAVMSELESQANRGRDIGWDGLSELERLAEYDAEGRIELEYVGRPPKEHERRRAYHGAIDALIREIAVDYDAVLVTSDAVQRKTARAKGLEVEYIAPEVRELERLPIEEFFDERTMSVHLKAGVRPMAKRGAVGDMHYETIRDEPITAAELKEFAHAILEGARRSSDAFVELDDDGMQIVQFGPFRIAIARPPFSDGWEITAVRALVKTSLEDYAHADRLQERLLDRGHGVLVAGSPGAGKSTFAQAIAEFLSHHDFVVKTMEKPRDLQVGPEITQYTALSGRMERTADSLLMVRPDYTIYDEIRKTADFEVFADMRLAGVGMIGVVHATRAIDALSRLVGRVDLGMIPQVVDTVVYIEDGRIETVYDVAIEVKLPEGLTEQDLARPVVVVRDFESGAPAYELYLFSRQVVTVPVGANAEREGGVERIAREEIEREVRSIARGHVDVELSGPDTAIVYVDEADISSVIGREGRQISAIEDRLGVGLDVRTHAERPGSTSAVERAPSGWEAHLTTIVTANAVVLQFDDHAGETVEIRADGDYLFTATVGRGGDIRLSRGSSIAEELERAIDRDRPVTAHPTLD